MKRIAAALCPVLMLALVGCAVRAHALTPGPVENTANVLDVQEGRASYYGPRFHGRTTASGVPFDMHAMVAAHPRYPFGTLVRVTNLENGRTVELEIVDRGPSEGPQSAGVIVDVSYGAAEVLDFVDDGLIGVRLEVLEWGD